MVLINIPLVEDIHSTLRQWKQGTCDFVPDAIQNFVDQPSLAQIALQELQQQVQLLRKLADRLITIADGVKKIHQIMEITLNHQWQSPSGKVFRLAVNRRQEHAQTIEAKVHETRQLAHQGIQELEELLASLQTLASSIRSGLANVASGAVEAVCK